MKNISYKTTECGKLEVLWVSTPLVTTKYLFPRLPVSPRPKTSPSTDSTASSTLIDTERGEIVGRRSTSRNLVDPKVKSHCVATPLKVSFLNVFPYDNMTWGQLQLSLSWSELFGFFSGSWSLTLCTKIIPLNVCSYHVTAVRLVLTVSEVFRTSIVL